MALASDGRMTYLNKNIISGVVFYFFINTNLFTHLWQHICIYKAKICVILLNKYIML